jgi:hypothetical protein
MVLLEDEADVLLVERDALLVTHRVDRLPKQVVLPTPAAVEHAEDAEERRLSGAGWPHHRHELPRLDVERDPPKDVESAGSRLHRLFDVAQRDQRAARRKYGGCCGGRLGAREKRHEVV